MKSPHRHKRYLLAPLLLGCWMVGSPALYAQESPPRQRGQARIEAWKNRENPEKRMEFAKRFLDELRRNGRHDEVRRMEMRMRLGQPRDVGRMGRPFDGAPKRPELQKRDAEAQGPFQKIRHLREAAEHLMAAGYEKQADMAQEEIKRLEKQAREEQEAREKEDKKIENPKPEQGNDSMEETMKNMRREMEDLRQQVRRLKADGESQPKRPNPEPR